MVDAKATTTTLKVLRSARSIAKVRREQFEAFSEYEYSFRVLLKVSTVWNFMFLKLLNDHENLYLCLIKVLIYCQIDSSTL